MTYLLIVSLIIFACVLLSRISGKLGIPILLSFIVLGMLFGSDGIFKIHFDDYSFAENICSVALIFIMFYGGFGTNVRFRQPGDRGKAQQALAQMRRRHQQMPDGSEEGADG